MQKRLVTRYATKSAEAADENQRRVEVVDRALGETPNRSSLVIRPGSWLIPAAPQPRRPITLSRWSAAAASGPRTYGRSASRATAERATTGRIRQQSLYRLLRALDRPRRGQGYRAWLAPS
jgi:hypothetical protein